MANRKSFFFLLSQKYFKILEGKVWGINFPKFIIEIIFVRIIHVTWANNSAEKILVFLSSKSVVLFEPSIFIFIFFASYNLTYKDYFPTVYPGNKFCQKLK